MDGHQVVVKQEPDSSSELDIVKVKKEVSEKRRGQTREAEKNRKNKVRSRRSVGKMEHLEQETSDLRARLENLQLGRH